MKKHHGCVCINNFYSFQTHFVEEPDTSHSDSSITRTDGEINEDLDGLNSDLLSARDMKEV